MRLLGRSRNRGQSLVEFALVAPLFFLVLFGTIELGRLVYTNHELANGTREGARLAMVRGRMSLSSISNGEIEARILDTTGGLDAGSLAATHSFADGPDSGEMDMGATDPGDQLTVTATYSYQPIIAGVLGAGTINLTQTSVVIVQH